MTLASPTEMLICFCQAPRVGSLVWSLLNLVKDVMAQGKVGPGRQDPAEAACVAQSLRHLPAEERRALEGKMHERTTSS